MITTPTVRAMALDDERRPVPGHTPAAPEVEVLVRVYAEEGRAIAVRRTVHDADAPGPRTVSIDALVL